MSHFTVTGPFYPCPCCSLGGLDDTPCPGRMAIMAERHETIEECARLADALVTPLDDETGGYPAHEAAAETAAELAARIRALATIGKQST